jgi:hypothetical protein
MLVTGETGVIGEKTVTVLLRPPQISCGLAWDRNGMTNRLNHDTLR